MAAPWIPVLGSVAAPARLPVDDSAVVHLAHLLRVTFMVARASITFRFRASGSCSRLCHVRRSPGRTIRSGFCSRVPHIIINPLPHRPAFPFGYRTLAVGNADRLLLLIPLPRVQYNETTTTPRAYSSCLMGKPSSWSPPVRRSPFHGSRRTRSPCGLFRTFSGV